MQSSAELLTQLQRLIPRYREFPDYVQAGESAVQGRGLFAKKDLPSGTIVAKLGGVLVHKTQVKDYLGTVGNYGVQINEDWYVSAQSKDEITGAINHSCEPTIGLRDELTFVTISDVRAGGELSADYEMTGLMEPLEHCNCGTTICRKKVTNEDWKVIRAEYEPYLSPYRKQLRHPETPMESELLVFLQKNNDELLRLRDEKSFREFFYH